MKYIFVASIICLSVACTKSKPQLTFVPEFYNFGEIERDTLYASSTIIKNTGGMPLEIQDVSADCGCTKVHVSKREIQAGDTCLLSFTYNTHHKIGEQESYVFITANTDSLIHALQINADIK